MLYASRPEGPFATTIIMILIKSRKDLIKFINTQENIAQQSEAQSTAGDKMFHKGRKEAFRYLRELVEDPETVYIHITED